MNNANIPKSLLWAGYDIKFLPNGEGVTATKGKKSWTGVSALDLRKKIFDY